MLCRTRDSADHGISDLSEWPLEALVRPDCPVVREAFELALDRRAAVGITFAGFSGGGGA